MSADLSALKTSWADQYSCIVLLPFRVTLHITWWWFARIHFAICAI